MDKKSVQQLIQEPFEEIAYHQGGALTGITFKVKPHSVLMMVKVQFRLDGHKIAYIETESFYECWQYLAVALYSNEIDLQWRKDKYAPS